MRTTLNLEEGLMRMAKKRAAETGRTLTALVESALRELLDRESRSKAAYCLRWDPVDGGPQVGVDLSDRDALIDRMEGRR